MSTWKKLAEQVLAEDRQYRGDTFIPYSELVRLFVGSDNNPGITGRPPEKEGGFAVGNYKFDPTILALGDSGRGDLNAWHDDLDTALARASTQSAKELQSGNPQGNHIVKKSYGGRISAQSAPLRPHHNSNIASSMDRYDVIIVAEIDQEVNKRGIMRTVGIIKRIAWAPSMGSQEERSQRLEDLLNGQKVDLPRRPQATRPVITGDDEKRWKAQKAQNAKVAGDPSAPEDDAPQAQQPRGPSAASNDAFRARLAKMDADYDGSEARPKHRDPDPEDALFWTPKDKK